MNLSEWSKKYNIPVNKKELPNRRIWVYVLIDPLATVERNTLFHLDDYLVSSCCGLTITVLPRTKK